MSNSSDADIRTALAPYVFASPRAQEQFLQLNGTDLAEVSPALLQEAVKVRLSENLHFLQRLLRRCPPAASRRRRPTRRARGLIGQTGLAAFAANSAALRAGQAPNLTGGMQSQAPAPHPAEQPMPSYGEMRQRIDAVRNHDPALGFLPGNFGLGGAAKK